MACIPALATGIFVDSAECPLLLTARPGAFDRNSKLVIINDPMPNDFAPSLSKAAAANATPDTNR
jgi:hypothetical protein